MIKAVLIDIDNTLLDFGKSAYSAIKDGFADRRLEFNENVMNVFHSVNDFLWGKIEKGGLTKEELFDVRWKMIFEKLEINADGHEFETYFRKYLFDSAFPIDGAVDLLKYLSSKYKIYSASNGANNQQINRLTNAGMIDYMQAVFTSQALGVQKPDKVFFEKCLDIMNCTYDEVIMIGDSLNADICGAKNVGIKTCLYSPNEDITSHNCADYIVKHLSEIKNIL